MQQHTGTAADRGIDDRLRQPHKLSGTLNRVLDALRVLLADNAFKETKSTRNMLAVYKEQNDHVVRFLSEWYECCDGSFVLEDDLYTHYKEDWCDNESIKPLSKVKFRDGVELWGPKRKRLNESGKRYFAFVGMESL